MQLLVYPPSLPSLQEESSVCPGLGSVSSILPFGNRYLCSGSQTFPEPRAWSSCVAGHTLGLAAAECKWPLLGDWGVGVGSHHSSFLALLVSWGDLGKGGEPEKPGRKPTRAAESPRAACWGWQ